MSKRMGIDYVLKIEDAVTAGTFNIVAGAKGGSLSMSADEIDVTTKDDNGWRTKVPSFKSWEVSHDGLIVASDEAFEALADAFMAGNSVKIEFAYTGSVGTEKYEGECLISSINLDAGFDAEATYSVSLSGAGALVRTSA